MITTAMKKLRVTERAMERIMVGVTRKDRIRNKDLQKKTKARNIIQELLWSHIYAR